MGWNSEKHRYECDRCGRPITRNNPLCKECDIWLKEYMNRKGSEDDKRQRAGRQEKVD